MKAFYSPKNIVRMQIETLSSIKLSFNTDGVEEL